MSEGRPHLMFLSLPCETPAAQRARQVAERNARDRRTAETVRNTRAESPKPATIPCTTCQDPDARTCDCAFDRLGGE